MANAKTGLTPSYLLALLPVIGIMKFSAANGLAPSRTANFGAVMIFSAAIGAPFLAYFVTMAVLGGAAQWLR